MAQTTGAVYDFTPLPSTSSVEYVAPAIDANLEREQQHRSQSHEVESLHQHHASRALTPSPLHSSHTRSPNHSSISSTSTSAFPPVPSSTAGIAASAFNGGEPLRLSPRKRIAALLAGRDSGSGNRAIGPPITASAVHHEQSGDIPNSAKKSSSTTLPSTQTHSSSSSTVMSSQNNILNKERPVRIGHQNAMPRNPSIESTVSSISSASQSYKSGSSLPNRGTPDLTISPSDVGSLISAAGSAENALLGLWKEKQSASAHNSQLWRLVEKQRAMILGLNKDLERALKDKERYRKKLKEHLSHIPHLPNAAHRVDSGLDRETSQSPAMSDNIEDSLQLHSNQRSETPSSPPRQATNEVSGTPDCERKNSISTSSNDLSPHSLPTERYHNNHVSKDDKCSPPSKEHKVSQVKNEELLQSHSTAEKLSDATPDLTCSSVMPSPSDNKQDDTHQMIVAPLNTKSKLSTVSVTDAKLVTEAISPKSTVSEKGPGLRKAPPRPLDLSKGAKVSAHLQDRQKNNETHSGKDGDDGDDILDTKELPTFDRGRRKTREEDDVLRESILIQQEHEQEQRSRSKKEKKSKSKSASKAVEGFVPPRSPNYDDNISPKTMIPRQKEQHDSGMISSPESEPASIGAMIMGSGPDSGPMSPRRTELSPPLLSPGLPQSPRPINNRGSHVPLPRSPKPNLVSPTTGPWPNPTSHTLSPRPPRENIPAPPMSPLALNSPHLARAEAYAAQISPPAIQPQQTNRERQEVNRDNQQSHILSQRPQTSQHQGNSLLQPNHPSHLDDHINEGKQVGDAGEKEQVFRGFVSEQYPDLLLPPNALPLIDVNVFSSRLRPSRWSFMAPDPQAEDPVFILAVSSRSEGKQLWRLEKTIVALPALDQQIRQMSNFNGKLPDRSLFQGHAPAKIDGRRAALNSYFGTLLETPMDEKAATMVCEFFSTDVIGAQDSDVQLGAAVAPDTSDSTVATTTATTSKVAKHHKEGFLTKRGKNFGGWKARFFILDGPELRYYETSDGAHLGTIKLQSAQIGKQSQQSSSGNSPSRPRDDDPENQYRHAFLILEPKRKDSRSLVRHVLCAESDEERDAWVEALLQFVDPPSDDHDHNSRKATAADGRKEQRSPHRPGPNKIRRERPRDNRGARTDGRLTPEADKRDTSQAASHIEGTSSDTPHGHMLHSSHEEMHGNALHAQSQTSVMQHQHPAISGPTNGAPIQNAESWGNKTSVPSAHLGIPVQPKEKETKKRSIFGFRGKGSDHLPFQNGHSPPGLYHQQKFGAPMGHVNGNGTGNGQIRAVFGDPLNEAVARASPMIPSSESNAKTGIQLSTYLPAVVYRCLEYLKAKDAASEEGIFRLSGSNIVIRNLRTRFNNEGDVRLLDEGQYYDIHAVASLLKLYLRELPVSILTRDLHLDFLKVLGTYTIHFLTLDFIIFC